MRKLIVMALLVLFFILTSGCTSSAYKDNMEKGNKAMEEQNYAAAVEAFSSAVEEEPDQKEAKDKLKKAKDLQLIEKIEINVEEGKTDIEEKEFSKGIKKLQKVLKEEAKNEKAKEIQADTTEYLDSTRMEIVKLIQESVEMSKKELEGGNFEAASSIMNLTKLNLLDNTVKEFISEEKDIADLITEVDKVYETAKSMKEAKELELAQKQAEEQKRKEEEQRRLAREQMELEIVRQHPEKALKISEIEIEEHESWDSFDVNFKVTNTSNVDFDRVKFKVTLFDSNNQPMTSETDTTYGLPAGEYELRSVSFFDQDPDGLNMGNTGTVPVFPGETPGRFQCFPNFFQGKGSV